MTSEDFPAGDINTDFLDAFVLKSSMEPVIKAAVSSPA